MNITKFTNPDGMGKLSENHLQNIRYHFVVTTAMIARYCVHNGMEQEKAYGLSDFYILKMDKCRSVEEISRLHDTMCIDYCQQMLPVIKKKGYFQTNCSMSGLYIQPYSLQNNVGRAFRIPSSIARLSFKAFQERSRYFQCIYIPWETAIMHHLLYMRDDRFLLRKMHHPVCLHVPDYA